MLRTYGFVKNQAGATFSNAKSLIFGGTDEYAISGYQASRDFDGASAFTLSFWVKSSTAATRALVSNYTLDNNEQGMTVYAVADHKLVIVLSTTTVGIKSEWKGDVALSTSNWNHVLVSMDGSKTMAGTTMRVNDTLCTLTNTVGLSSFVGTISSGKQWAMGRLGDVSFGFLVGSLDEFALYTVGYTTTTAFRSAGGAAIAVPTANRVGYFRNGDHSGDSISVITDEDGLSNMTPQNMEAGDVQSDAP